MKLGLKWLVPIERSLCTSRLGASGNKIVMDAAKMLYPGDFHFTKRDICNSAAERHLIGTDLMDLSGPVMAMKLQPSHGPLQL